MIRDRFSLRLRSVLVVGIVAVAGAGYANGESRLELLLMDAVKTGNREAVQKLLLQKVDVNHAQADGTTALHWAAHLEDVEIATALLRAGAAADARNRYGVSPLMLAANNGSAAVTELLLAAGADPRRALPEGETPLMAAAATGSVETLKLLMAHGADVNAREGWHGQTTLMWAAAENHAEAVEALIAGGADLHARSKGGFTALLFAARSGQIDAIRALLRAGADINETVQTNSAPLPPPPSPSYFSRAAGRSGATRASGRTMPSSEAENSGALILAIANGHFEAAKSLVEQGADPNADGQGWSPLHQLAWTRRPNRGKGLAPAVHPDAAHSLDLAKTLLARGANPNARVKRDPRDGNRHNWTRVGATPFIVAAFGGDVALMRLLLEHGADPKLATVENVTALMAASGVGVYNAGEYGGTNKEALEAVKLAFEGGIDVNAIDANGNTALHGVALRGANEVARFLAERGARLDLKNSDGFTPLRIADGVFVTGTVKRQPETAALLRQLMKARGVLRPEEEVPGVDVAVAERRRPQ
jgi:ankyrin repeat protein